MLLHNYILTDPNILWLFIFSIFPVLRIWPFVEFGSVFDLPEAQPASIFRIYVNRVRNFYMSSMQQNVKGRKNTQTQ